MDSYGRSQYLKSREAAIRKFSRLGMYPVLNSMLEFKFGFELVLDLMQSTFLIVVVPLLLQIDWTGIMSLTLDRWPMVTWFGTLLAWAGHLSWGSLDQTLDQLMIQFLKKVCPNCCLFKENVHYQCCFWNYIESGPLMFDPGHLTCLPLTYFQLVTSLLVQH